MRLTCSIATLENEATWIKFQAQNGRRYAIKVYAGGVNAVSGLPSITAAPSGQQDYVVIPEQRWLDGIAVKAGLVRQFVAVPLGKNRTVEGQITGSEQFAGIQFEIVKGIVWKRFRVYCADGTVITLPVDDGENVDGLCRIISEKLGKTLEASDLYDRNKMVRLERSRNENLRETRLRNVSTRAKDPFSYTEIARSASGLAKHISSRRALPKRTAWIWI